MTLVEIMCQNILQYLYNYFTVFAIWNIGREFKILKINLL